MNEWELTGVREDPSLFRGGMMKKLALMLVGSVVTLVGCASMSVSGDALQSRTGFALGLSSDAFTISNRTDSGVRTDYTVTTKTNKTYSCYVTGTIGVVSDAICTQMQATASTQPVAAEPTTKAAEKPAAKAAPASSCNALLKAAGKC